MRVNLGNEHGTRSCEKSQEYTKWFPMVTTIESEEDKARIFVIMIWLVALCRRVGTYTYTHTSLRVNFMAPEPEM